MFSVELTQDLGKPGLTKHRFSGFLHELFDTFRQTKGEQIQAKGPARLVAQLPESSDQMQNLIVAEIYTELKPDNYGN